MCSGHLKIILWENASQKPGDKVVGITSIWKKSLYYMAFQNYAILHQKIQNAKFNLTLQNPKSPAKIQNLGRLLHKFRAIQSRCLGLRGSSSHWEPVWTKTLGEERKTSGQQKREQEGAKTTPSHSPNCIQIRLVLVTFGGLQCYHCVAVECVCGRLPHPPETCPGWPPQAPACFKKLTSTKCQGPLQNGTLQNDPEVLNSTENVSTQWLWQKVSTKCASAQNAGTKSISQHQVHCLVKRFTVN